MCEYKVRNWLGDKTVENPADRLSYYCKAMDEHSDEYLNYIIEKQHETNGTVIVEQRVTYEKYVPFGSGMADCIIIGDEELIIVDFKYGEGVPVSAENNTQLMLYALGAVLEFDYIYQVTNIRVCVFQPRLHNISEWSLPETELLEWAENFVKPRAELAYKGEGELCAGEWCRWCKVKAACRARAEKQLELAKYKFRHPTILEDWEVAEILGKISEFKKWAGDVEEYAYEQALKGNEIKGYKLVEGISRRSIVSPTDVENALTKEGYTKERIYAVPKLLGITELEKLVGAKRFKELCNEWIVKPQGKPTLVPESDKRPAIKTKLSAAEAFAEEE
jgi:hypothetical protein